MQKKLIDFYNNNASYFDEEQEQDSFKFVRLPEWNIGINAIKKIAQKKHSLLEIGAGTGRFSLEIAPSVRQVTAVDISKNMLDIMAQKSVEKGITNVKQICGDFLDIPFQEKFDIIISFSAIEYILNPQALFAKIADILAPGGHLIIATAHDTYIRWWGRLGNYFRQGVFMEAYSKKRMRRLLTANGLEVKELTDFCLKSLFVKGILLFVYATKK